MLTELIRDARMHQLDPELAARKGVFALDSPAPRLFAVGLVLIVMGAVFFLTGELFKRKGVSFLRRAASAGMAVLLALLSVNAFAVTVFGQDHPHHSGHSHAPGAAAAATPDQMAAAEKLLRDVRASLTRYMDVSAAEATGYRQTTPYRFLRWGPAHFHNYAYNRDDGLLDPRRPESLVYFKLPDGQVVLIGAMFLAPKGKGPRSGGSMTEWHVHDNLCITATGSVALSNAQGRCPPGAFFIGDAVEMMHVWIFNHPDGPFAHDMNAGAIKAALAQYGGR